MSTTTLPSAKDVKDLLTGLVGKPVAVAPGKPVTPTPQRPASLAVYVDPQSHVTALCMMDLGLSGFTAGALAMLPAGGVEDCIEEGELSEMLVEALHEVVNIVSAVFNTPGSPHARLDRLYAPGQPISGDLTTMVAGFMRLDLDVDVPGYGAGQLSIVLP